MKTAIRSGFNIVLAALREIFDENAYTRFLRREKLVPSRHAYRRFTEECERQRVQRVRCC